jgi:hypothetical protein
MPAIQREAIDAMIGKGVLHSFPHTLAAALWLSSPLRPHNSLLSAGVTQSFDFLVWLSNEQRVLRDCFNTRTEIKA